MIHTFFSYVIISFCLLAQPPGEVTEALGIGVLLTDAAVLYEGKIDHVGSLYRVMSAGRTEIVREVNVAFTGQSREDAYEYLVSKKKPAIAEDAARLADWCMKNTLPKQAISEAKQALKLAPDNKAIAKLVHDCEENAKKVAAKPVIRIVGTASTSPITPTAAVMAPATLPNMMTTGAGKPILPRSAELEASFAKSVQPMLMNLCANCHSDSTRQLNFRITRIPEGITLSPKTAENVVASMSQISKEQPTASPLLVMAITPHGGRTTAPLSRASGAYKNLEIWIAKAAGSMPTLAATEKKVIVVSNQTPAIPKESEATMPHSLPVINSVPVPPKPAVVKPVDPFDPAEFNKLHSDPKKQ